MKKRFVFFSLLLVLSLLFTGCGSLLGLGGDGVQKFDDEMTAATGTWRALGDEDTYFTFDGTKDVMTFSYVEDGVEKYHGTYRAIYRGLGKDVQTPLDLLFTRSDKEKEDWLSCYVEGFTEDFSQFTVMKEEEDLGVIGGSVYTHIYRISELPYRLGTYVLEGKEYKEETNNYAEGNAYCIPSGTYTTETGESFTFLSAKPVDHVLFQYKNGDVFVEGTLKLSQDNKTAYLYVENDPYSKVTSEDKQRYDTTFSIYYPPDFYLYGDFTVKDGAFSVDGLYHHPETPSKVEDAAWTFGTYTK